MVFLRVRSNVWHPSDWASDPELSALSKVPLKIKHYCMCIVCNAICIVNTPLKCLNLCNYLYKIPNRMCDISA